MADSTAKSPARTLIIYILVVVFACVCSTIVISQRLQIARVGGTVSELHDEAVHLRERQLHLQNEVARKASYSVLVEQAARLKLDLVPPEERKAPESSDQ